jgi:chromate reductase
MRVLAFAASLRKDSWNRKLISVAAGHLRALGADVDLADFHEFDMPLYDADVEIASGMPAGTVEFNNRVAAAQAVVISTPEYNASIPGVLKNALDWSSRPKPHPWVGKPMQLLTASPGAFGGARGAWQTRIPFEAIGAHVPGTMFHLAKADTAFAGDGALADGTRNDQLHVLLGNFLKFATKLTA